MSPRLLVPVVLGLLVVVLLVLAVQAWHVFRELVDVMRVGRVRAALVAVVGVAVALVPWAWVTVRLYFAGRITVPPWRLSLGALRGEVLRAWLSRRASCADATAARAAGLAGEVLT